MSKHLRGLRDGLDVAVELAARARSLSGLRRALERERSKVQRQRVDEILGEN